MSGKLKRESKSEWVRKEIRKYVRNKSPERELVAKLIYKDWLFSRINTIERLFLFTIAIKSKIWIQTLKCFCDNNHGQRKH